MAITDPQTLFDRWFNAAFDNLKSMPNGDGAIGGMMIALPLFERYVHIKKSHDTSGSSFYQIMSQELSLGSAAEAEEFWKTFRHGFCHTGMPFDADRGSNPLPKVSFHHSFPALPSKTQDSAGNDVITLDPWKFIEHVRNIYANDPNLLTQHSQAPLLPIHTLAT